MRLLRPAFRFATFGVIGGLIASICSDHAQAVDLADPVLQVPAVGDTALHILTPTLLELVRINTKPPDPAGVDSWDWVNSQGTFVPPDLSSVKVIVNGQTNNFTSVGFKRRPFYAPYSARDLRIANSLYLELGNPIADGTSVQVLNDGTVWPTNLTFAAVTSPFRYSPAIHVNQEGYLPGYPKKVIVGYYLGDMGELAIPANTFSVIDAHTGGTVYRGTLTRRADVGYTYSPTPYQDVYEADFSSFNPPGGAGEYRVVVPGMGGSFVFRIDAGIGMDFARTFALGLFEQRSGYDVAMPFTRFTHAADHLAPASVPVDTSAPFQFTWTTIATYATEMNPDNPPQTAPALTNPAVQLFPFVNAGPVDVSGGHFEAGDYNRVTYNGAQVIHALVFAADALPGVGALDNLGLPESGDGISDVLQEAKWEADFLVKMQDADGGFYYSVYPQYREYETDVLPENGDPQVVWPKNTSTTAAAVAALAECASSPRFKQAFPQAASNYWAKAQLGWRFLTNAIARYGLGNTYQRIQQFGDYFADRDELSWAACELFLATGDSQYRTLLESWFPDPTDPATSKWGWWWMYGCYGNVIRDYATAVSSGRLQTGQLNSDYLARCISVITNYGNEVLQWSQENAYGSSFPDQTKAPRAAGWYFSSEQAFDLVVAQLFNPNPAYVDAILLNLNYEAGCNPVNVPYLTGLGWKRQRTIVDQYSNNDRRVLPKDGVPISNVQEGFVWTFTYGYELTPLCYPFDGAQTAPYPFYDRWCDFFNVTTEGSTTDTVRGYDVALWLAAQTSLTGQLWHSTNATLITPSSVRQPGVPVTVALQVADTNLDGARIVWEALSQEPTFGGLQYTFTPSPAGLYWVEAEVQWPDGRRAFAMGSVNVSLDAAPELTAPVASGGQFTFQLTGSPDATFIIEASSDLATWQPVVTNTLSPSGTVQIAQPIAPSFVRRYYRAVRAP